MAPQLEKLFDRPTIRALKRIESDMTKIAEAAGATGSDFAGPRREKLLADIEAWMIAARLRSLEKTAGIKPAETAAA